MRRTSLFLSLVLVLGTTVPLLWRLRSHTAPQSPSTPTYLEQGEAAWKEGHIRDAVILFNRAIAVSPKEERAYLQLAQLYKSQDRADLAIDVLEMLKASNPDAPHLPMQMAEEGLDVEDKPLAQDWAEKALQKEPQNARSHLIYALTQINRKRFDEALATLLKAQCLAPNDLEIGQALAEIYQMKGDYQKSIQVGQALLQSNPRSSRLHNRMGVAYAKLGSGSSLSKAEQHFKTAIEIMPDWYEPYLELAKLAIRQRTPEVAQSYLEKAWERDPTVLEVGERLTQLWGQQNDARNEGLSARLVTLRLEKRRYEASRRAEETQTLPPAKIVEIAKIEGDEGRYAIALHRLKKLLAHDSTYLPALRLYRSIDMRARAGYPEYLLPGPHITLELGS